MDLRPHRPQPPSQNQLFAFLLHTGNLHNFKRQDQVFRFTLKSPPQARGVRGGRSPPWPAKPQIMCVFLQFYLEDNLLNVTSLSSPVWPLKGRREVLNWSEVDSLGNWSSAGQMQSVKEDTYILLKMKANSQSYDRLHKRVLEVRRTLAEIQTKLGQLFRTTAHQKGTTRLYSSRRSWVGVGASSSSFLTVQQVKKVGILSSPLPRHRR